MQKIKVTALQRANAIEARDVMWPSVPARSVYPGLNVYTMNDSPKTDCKTIACFGGWCGRWPPFVRQGVSIDEDGWPTIGWLLGVEVSKALFGDDGELFRPRGGHPADAGFTGSDHALVTRRLNWLITNSEVIE